jgi:D-glycero-alpha-D-manno-heptose-7-phosphate kinase
MRSTRSRAPTSRRSYSPRTPPASRSRCSASRSDAQDQYAAAVGGFNLIEFLPRGGGLRIEPIIAGIETFKTLHRSLLLFYTGRQRSPTVVLVDQRAAIRAGTGIDNLRRLSALAYELRDRIAEGDAEALGSMLHESWQLKRGLSEGISNDDIDGIYAQALDAGATGGKILGAAPAAFCSCSSPPERQAKVRSP